MFTYANLKRYFSIRPGKEWVEAFCHRVGVAPRESETVGLVFYLLDLSKGPSASDDKLEVVVDQSHAIALARGLLNMAEQNKWTIPAEDTLEMKVIGGGSKN